MRKVVAPKKLPITSNQVPSTLTNKTFDFTRAVEFLKNKCQWTTVRKKFADAGFAPGVSWESLKGKVAAATTLELVCVKTVLDQLTTEVVFAGTKDLFIICLDDQDVTAIAGQLSGLSTTTNDFSSRFPYALSPNELSGRSRSYELAAKHLHSNGDVSIVLCARRTEEERERFAYNTVTHNVQQAFAGVDEFITVKRRPYQIFDVFNFRPALKRLEILIDYPDRIHKPESADERFLAVLQQLCNVVPALTNFYQKNQPLNLHPTVNGLYSDSREGRVTKLSCRLPTGPVVKQVMSSTDDLRNEAFHAAGVAAVGQILPNHINVVWDTLLNVDGAVEIAVGGPVQSVSTSGAYVRSCRLVNIRADAGVVIAANKLIKFT